MNKIFLKFLESTCNLYECFKKNIYIKISTLIFLLIVVSHFGWIFNQMPHDDLWHVHSIARKSLSSVLEIQSKMFGSLTYRFLHIPLYWFLNIFFGSNWWMYNSLNVFLHFLNIIIFGKIIHNKTRSIEIASLSLVFLALMPTAVTVFGMRSLYSTFSTLLLLICLYVFHKRGLTLLNSGVCLLGMLVSLSIYEVPFPSFVVFGFLIMAGRERFKYLLFMCMLSFCYLLPNLIFFPKFKMGEIAQRSFEFSSIIEFLKAPGSIIYIFGVFRDRISGLSWDLADILKLAISVGLVCFIWNYARIEKITKENAKEGFKRLFFYSSGIILPFIITCVLTWSQKPYMYYAPSFGLSLFVPSVLILFFRKKITKKIIFFSILFIVILSNMVLFSSQRMWKDASKTRFELFAFLDEYEENIPDKSSIVLINVPRIWQIPDFLYSQVWVFQNMLEWRYNLKKERPKTIWYNIIQYYSGVYDVAGFSEIFLKSNTIEIDSMSFIDKNKHVPFSDIYLLGYDNQGFYPISKVLFYDDNEKNILKFSNFASKVLKASKPISIVEGKGIKKISYQK